MKLRTIAIGLWLAGCHGGAVKDASAAKLTVERLYPLRAGSVWSYDVETGEGPPTLAITRVTSAANGSAEVSSGGAPIRYELRSDGLFRADRGVYTLKEPLAQGTRWETGPGGEAEITAVGKHVSTLAGEFDGCLEVLEREPGAQKQVRTVFCPDVGPVEVESTIALQLNPRGARVFAKLRGYDFAGALGAPP